MKYCAECGTQLPDDANFCTKCGKPQAAPPGEAAPASPPDLATGEAGEWEECEITAVMAGERWSPVFPSEMIKFAAQATGEGDGRTIRESPPVKAGLADYYQANKANKFHIKAVEELAAALAADGWERAGKGEAWFSRRFRRRRD